MRKAIMALLILTLAGNALSRSLQQHQLDSNALSNSEDAFSTEEEFQDVVDFAYPQQQSIDFLDEWGDLGQSTLVIDEGSFDTLVGLCSEYENYVIKSPEAVVNCAAFLAPDEEEALEGHREESPSEFIYADEWTVREKREDELAGSGDGPEEAPKEAPQPEETADAVEEVAVEEPPAEAADVAPEEAQGGNGTDDAIPEAEPAAVQEAASEAAPPVEEASEGEKAAETEAAPEEPPSQPAEQPAEEAPGESASAGDLGQQPAPDAPTEEAPAEGVEPDAVDLGRQQAANSSTEEQAPGAAFEPASVDLGQHQEAGSPTEEQAPSASPAPEDVDLGQPQETSEASRAGSEDEAAKAAVGKASGRMLGSAGSGRSNESGEAQKISSSSSGDDVSAKGATQKTGGGGGGGKITLLVVAGIIILGAAAFAYNYFKNKMQGGSAPEPKDREMVEITVGKKLGEGDAAKANEAEKKPLLEPGEKTGEPKTTDAESGEKTSDAKTAENGGTAAKENGEKVN